MAKVTGFTQHKLPSVMRSRHVSGADYSADVFFPAYRADGSTRPGRPWFWAAFEQFDLAQAIADRMRSPSDMQKAFAAAALDFHGIVLDEIESKKWEWDRLTRRKNGALVGSPRDIVDTGELRNSQEFFVSSSSSANN